MLQFLKLYLSSYPDRTGGPKKMSKRYNRKTATRRPEMSTKEKAMNALLNGAIIDLKTPLDLKPEKESEKFPFKIQPNNWRQTNLSADTWAARMRPSVFFRISQNPQIGATESMTICEV